MRALLILTVSLAMLAACTPADEQYCTKMGVGGSAEWGKCMSYYHAQENWFANDHAVCDLQADQTYPPTLYDHGGYVSTIGGPYWGPWGPPSSGMAYVEPNYARNAEVDRLRLRIVGPCMSAKGWNSPSSWQAGRHSVTPLAAAKQVPAAKRKTLAVTPSVTAPDAAPSSLNSLPWLQ